MISTGSFLFGSGLAMLLALAGLIGPSGAKRCAVTLAANWLSCMTFVMVSGNYTPWGWFWAMDLLSAIALTIRPISKCQRALVYSYMLQFGFHAAFGLGPFLKGIGLPVAGGDPIQYLHRLDLVLIVQMALVFIWTGAHGLSRFFDLHSLGVLRVHRGGGEASR